MAQTISSFFSGGTSAGGAAVEQIDQMLSEALVQEVFPGCVLLVGRNGQPLYYKSCGYRSKPAEDSDLTSAAPMTAEMVFDIAAVTEVFITTTILMQLVSSGVVSLNDRIYRYIQAFAVSGKETVTIGHVLSQASGLAQYQSFYEELDHENNSRRLGIMGSRSAREYVYNSINRSSIKFAPGSRQLYSDLGYMLLGQLIEMLTGLSLERAAQKYIFQPLQLQSSGFVNMEVVKRKGLSPNTAIIAPTEDCAWRKREICGEVHDENAWAMGGVAGHSGMFSTAADLHRFASELIFCWQGKSEFLDRQVLQTFWSGQGISAEGSWVYGWEHPSRDNRMLESGLSPAAVGQNGLTGCSLWIDPEKGLDIVLMTNRINLGRNNKKIMAFRAELTRLVLQAFAL